MNCKDVATFLDDYLAGELPAHKKFLFDFHLKLCRDCRNYLAGYQRSALLSRSAYLDQQSLPIPQDLLNAILQANQSKP